MKIALFAAALIATPALAQTTPPPSSTMPDQSMQSGASSTPDTSMQTAPAMPNGSSSDPSMTTSTTGSTAPMANDPSTMANTSPAPAPMASYPWCRPGQYTGCREHENAKGQGVHRSASKTH